MVLVAIALVAVIAIAAMSIDVVTLYLAREEAQRSADAAALAAAKIISLSGVTSDPNNTSGAWQTICGGPLSPATQAAKSVGGQSTVGSIIPIVNVSYAAGGTGPLTDSCAGLPFASGVNNPMVVVQVVRAGLPTFFSRIWGNTGNSVSATATAEAFNPSNSARVGNAITGTITPVTPRCVKPWVVPNKDPLNQGLDGTGKYCDEPGSTTTCQPLVNLQDGRVLHSGISLDGTGTTGVVGEKFWLEPDCIHSGGFCRTRNLPPIPNFYAAASSGAKPFLQRPPSLEYLPGEPPATSVAVPSLAVGRLYEQAVAGCDQTTVYHCGVNRTATATPNRVDMAENPSQGSNDTMHGVMYLIHEADDTDPSPSGQDTIDSTVLPFKISPGTSNALFPGAPAGSSMTVSPSIVSFPIYDQAAVTINPGGTTDISIVGFLQVFINRVDTYGNVNVTVLNVAGCSNGGGTDPVGTPVSGSSPVPVRLITPP